MGVPIFTFVFKTSCFSNIINKVTLQVIKDQYTLPWTPRGAHLGGPSGPLANLAGFQNVSILVLSNLETPLLFGPIIDRLCNHCPPRVQV